MKKKLSVFCVFLITSLLFAEGEEAPINVSSDSFADVKAEPSVEVVADSIESGLDGFKLDAVSSAQPGEKIELAGVSDVPSSKRPKKPDSDRCEELNDTDREGMDKNPDILKFGLEDDISELLDKMIKNKDVRFVEEVYDLFQETKSVALRDKILTFFKTIEDPCLEDYAVMILNDPYDEKRSTVASCFSYIQSCGTKEAVPAVVTLLESDDEEYFLNSLETLGKIGGAKEALYLSQYLEKDDLSLAQKQSLVRVLGQLHAVETYDALVELAQDADENGFIRMYSAEAIGQMEKKEAVPVLVELFEDENPNLRASVIKGLSHFDEEDAKNTIIQGIKDSHQKVRNEAISAVKTLKIKEADEYLIYRAKNDKEPSVKKACYSTLAYLDTDKANEYLLSQITEKKVPDAVKLEVSKALLAENEKGTKEIAALAMETVKDDRRKQLRYGLGKEIAKYKNSDFSDVTLAYVNHKDTSTIGTGLDMFAKGRYSNCDEAVKTLAEKADLNAKSKNAMAIKAAKILGMDVDKMTEEKDKEREAEEALKKAKSEKSKAAFKAQKEADKKSSSDSSKDAK